MTPFTRESCPKNALWEYCAGSTWITVQYYSDDGIRLNTGDFKTWEQLASGWSYSIDGGETWHPAYTP